MPSNVDYVSSHANFEVRVARNPCSALKMTFISLRDDSLDFAREFIETNTEVVRLRINAELYRANGRVFFEQCASDAMHAVHHSRVAREDDRIREIRVQRQFHVTYQGPHGGGASVGTNPVLRVDFAE